uniref:Uncharacterized protein n=1 Tax=Myoviridae sp. ctiv53 TaxID=2827703 RepID=A0A8S5THK6_9CAUD|nr:MAG TPA: hypothetical protein [Myoviridae sp. ctiv53]DAX36608.1 MAG TPA: hypothetical protein [Caudoviricetes sp.]
MKAYWNSSTAEITVNPISNRKPKKAQASITPSASGRIGE